MTTIPSWALDAATDILSSILNRVVAGEKDVVRLFSGLSRDEIAGMIVQRAATSRESIIAARAAEWREKAGQLAGVAGPHPEPPITPDRLDAIRRAAENKPKRPGPRLKEVKPKSPPADLPAAIHKHLKAKKGHKDRISRLAGILSVPEADIELAIAARGSGLEYRDGYVVEAK